MYLLLVFKKRPPVNPALFYLISRLAFSEGLLTNRLGWISFAIADVFHVADVSRNVFKAW